MSDPHSLNQNKKPTLSLVFSFKNEEEVIPVLIPRVRKVMREEMAAQHLASYEMIFVNDCSTDKSLEVLLPYAQDAPKDIRIINMSRTFGVSPCVMAGLSYTSGDLVVYMDCDLQDPPEVIPEMIRAWREGDAIDVVHTVRKTRQGESRIKLFVTRIGYAILHKITPIKIPIEVGDFKLLSRRAVNHMLQLKEKKPFLRGLVCWIGFNQTQVEYHRAPRAKGQTKFKVFSPAVISNYLESALISFSSFPLQMISLIGLLSILLSLGLGFHVFLEKISGKAIPGWTAIMTAVLFLGSVQLLCLGVIGLYLHNIFEESKGRPNFIIESTYGFPGQTPARVQPKNEEQIVPL